jgi:transcriptional regulator with XRE-family HTH domain
MSKVGVEGSADMLKEVRRLFGKKQSEISAETGLCRSAVQRYIAMVRKERGVPTAADIAAETRAKIDKFVESIGLDKAMPRVIVAALGVSSSQANRALYRLRRAARLGKAAQTDASLAAAAGTVNDPGVQAHYGSVRIHRRPAKLLFRVVEDELYCDNREPRDVRVGNYIGEVTRK